MSARTRSRRIRWPAWYRLLQWQHIVETVLGLALLSAWTTAFGLNAPVLVGVLGAVQVAAGWLRHPYLARPSRHLPVFFGAVARLEYATAALAVPVAYAVGNSAGERFRSGYMRGTSNQFLQAYEDLEHLRLSAGGDAAACWVAACAVLVLVGVFNRARAAALAPRILLRPGCAGFMVFVACSLCYVALAAGLGRLYGGMVLAAAGGPLAWAAWRDRAAILDRRQFAIVRPTGAAMSAATKPNRPRNHGTAPMPAQSPSRRAARRIPRRPWALMLPGVLANWTSISWLALASILVLVGRAWSDYGAAAQGLALVFCLCAMIAAQILVTARGRLRILRHCPVSNWRMGTTAAAVWLAPIAAALALALAQTYSGIDVDGFEERAFAVIWVVSVTAMATSILIAAPLERPAALAVYGAAVLILPWFATPSAAACVLGLCALRTAWLVARPGQPGRSQRPKRRDDP